MAERCWTPDQKNAINARDGAVLVSAAAGSGKTAVLVERVIQILTDKNKPCDADRLLVVTFTKAAAAEMKERISTRISEMLQLNPMNKNLQRQQLMLSNAHISTIHSFCNELIRENFFELNMSSEFRIADENEMLLLKDEAMQIALEKKYESASNEFLNLVETITSGRDDKKLMETVLTLYEFIRSHPFPEKWLEDKLGFYRGHENVSETIFAKLLLEYAHMALGHCIVMTETSLRLIQDVEKIKLAYEETLLCEKEMLIETQKVLNGSSWNEISSTLKQFKFATLKRLTGCSDDIIKKVVLQNRQEVKDIIKSLTKLFFVSEEQCKEDLKILQPLMEELFALVREFSAQLDILKQEKNVVDFGDLEHLTLKLLVRQCGDGFEKTELAQNLSRQFDFVMVDEYQDTNEAQDMIFRALSNDEQNLFVVGDVKQSIYGFRQAMPEIFLRRKQRYELFDEQKVNYPAKIILDRNFRSRAGILDATNFVFSQLMSTAMGEVEYDKEERLTLGAAYSEVDEPNVEIKVLDLSAVAEEENMNVVEARYIAKRIAQMIGEKYTIMAKERARAVTYGDFCILLRSANKHAAEFVKELEKCGIPAWSDTSNSFFGTVEIATMLSLLKVIDNPIQDVPLLAVLLSPIFAFTTDDLSEIRMEDKAVPLYFAIKQKATSGDKKCENFLQEISNYRRLAATLPSDKLIQYIYEKTSYSEIVQATSGGDLKLKNLRLLLEYARNYESAGYKGLTGFIRFIERLEEQKADLSASNALSEGANVVKIMSIHRSKGLEFPVCFLANSSRKFNKDVGEILFHPELGPGFKLLDQVLMRKYTTFQRDATKLDLDKKAMSEELRVLYVAMTRAREKLIILSSLKNSESTLSKLGAQITDGEVISPFVVGSANSFSDWLLMCALRHPNGAKLRDVAGVLPEVVVSDKTRIDIDIVGQEDELVTKEKVTQEQEKKIIDKALLEKINSRINFAYKYDELARIPAKVTVSELVSDAAPEVKFDFAKRPAFLSDAKLNPAQKGTALHAFMQFVDLKQARSDLEEAIGGLVSRGFLSQEQANVLNRAQIKQFLCGELCERILVSPSVTREYRFAININACEVMPDIKKEFSEKKIMLQGAIDCVFEENGELVIVDYKTDKTASEQALRAQYGRQLELYSKALRECTGKNIAQKILYSFYTGRGFSF